MAKHICKNCKKKFEYDNFYGICPKCGTYNRKEESGTDMVGNITGEEGQIGVHNRYDREKRYAQCVSEPSAIIPPDEEEKKRRGKKRWFLILLAAIVLILAFELIQVIRFVYQAEAFRKNRDFEQVECAAGEKIVIDDASIEIISAVELVPENTNDVFPEDEKLIGVYVRYLVKGYAQDSESVFGIPIVEKSNGIYTKNLYKNMVVNYVEEFDIKESQIVDVYSRFYSGEETEGYITFLVDKEETAITVFLPEENEFQGKKAVKKMYKVMLPIEERGMTD